MDRLQPIGRLDPNALEIRLVLLDLGGSNRENPLLGGLLHPPVERGDDFVPASVELLLAAFSVGAENSYEEVAYAVHKVGRAHFF